MEGRSSRDGEAGESVCCSQELAALVEHRLLDDLVRPQQQRLRDRAPERLGGLEIDDQLELRGLLDWQVRRLGTLRIACFYLLRRSRKSAMNLSEIARTFEDDQQRRRAEFMVLRRPGFADQQPGRQTNLCQPFEVVPLT